MSKPCIVMTTASSQQEAETIAHAVLTARLAACVQLQAITSLYWWGGKIDRADEKLLLCKTMQDKYERLREAILSVHSYETPEILQVPVDAGLDRYVAWLAKETA